MNCPRCNTSLVEDARFCGVCGLSISSTNNGASEADSFAPDGQLDDKTYLAPRGDDRYAQTPPVSLEAEPPARPGQPSTQPGWYGGQIAPQQPTQQALSWPQQQAQPQQVNAWPPQPTQQALSWPQQQQAQPQQAAWQQQQQAQPQQAAWQQQQQPGTWSPVPQTPVASPTRKPRRAGGCLLRIFLVLILLAAVLVGAWFLALRPYLHNIAQAQLTQALSDAESQALLFQAALPPGNQTVQAREGDINNYLTAHSSGQLQNLHMTITPSNIRLDFGIYGLANTITAVPVASHGDLTVTDVQVQGVIWLVMSNAELTSTLNNSFQQFGDQTTRSIQKVILREHEIDLQVQ